jgi:hypothetical protein
MMERVETEKLDGCHLEYLGKGRGLYYVVIKFFEAG